MRYKIDSVNCLQYDGVGLVWHRQLDIGVLRCFFHTADCIKTTIQPPVSVNQCRGRQQPELRSSTVSLYATSGHRKGPISLAQR